MTREADGYMRAAEDSDPSSRRQVYAGLDPEPEYGAVVARDARGATFAVEGEIESLSAAALRLLLERGTPTTPALSARVSDLIEQVRRDGDSALLRFARVFDGVDLEHIEVPPAVVTAALAAIDVDVRRALELARDAITAFHRAQLPVAHEIETRPGVRLGRRPDALRRVGVYAPGGRAAYPSSVLMGVVPAKVAGVGEVVVCSPPGEDGWPSREVLAACALAGADRVFALGGAGAVAALAYGTAIVPRVDKVVGPGNAYVTEAKRQLGGVVATDGPAGPSEVLIIADESSDAGLIAAELIAQAEHDPDAAAVLVATDAAVIAAAKRELAALLEEQPRRTIIEQSFAARGGLLLAENVAAAVAFAERYAPEHLLLLTSSPGQLLDSVRGVGTVFLGACSSVAFGDYVTGANHVLPTAGRANAWSGLATADFLRWTTWQEVSPAAAAALAGPTATLAEAEGLPGHALAARMRSGGMAGAAPMGPPREPRLRSAYAEIHLYDPGRTPCSTDLSDNTNLFGMSPAASEVVASPPSALVTRYPSVYADRLKRAIAERFGVAPENVTTGCGSDDVIDSAVRAFCEPGATLAHPSPTFGVVPLFARMNAVRPVAVPLGPGFALDASALLGTRAELAYVCRPNNPTGTQFDRAEVERVCREAAGIVVVDEAYSDFAGDDLVAFAVSSTRTVVVRTFSKAWGMAGLRLGFAIGPESMIHEIEKSRGPYKISALAEAAALAALDRDGDWVRAGVDAVTAHRDRLATELRRLGLRALPSSANFLLVPVPVTFGTALDLGARLVDEGIAVRPFPDLPHVGDCIRVTVGPWPMLQRFLSALERVLDRERLNETRTRNPELDNSR